MKTGHMPNAPDAMRVGPRTITGSKKGDDNLMDTLGDMGALAGQAKEAYEKKQEEKKERSNFLEKLKFLSWEEK